MSISMTPDEVAELDKMLGGNELSQTQAPEPVQETKAQDAPEPQKEPERQEARTEGEPKNDTVDNPDDGLRPIPVRRHKEILEGYRSKYDAEKHRADELQAKYDAFAASQTKPEPDDDDAWLREALGETKTRKSDSDVPDWAKAVQRDAAEMREERNKAMLNTVLQQAKTDYPDIPETVVLAGLANKNSLEEIANSWDWMGKQYLASQSKRESSQGNDPKRDVAPRLPASKGKMNPEAPPAHAKTWSENSKRVQDWFRTQG